MTTGARRPFAVATVLAAMAFAVSACSSSTATTGSSPDRSAGASAARSTAARPTAEQPTAAPSAPAGSAAASSPPAADSSSPAGPGASSGGQVTSTPGLQLQGPRPLPSRAQLSPVRVRIPAIGVDSTLQHLKTVRGVLQPPTDPLRAGWWAGGPVPGEPGPAVIAGHLDSYTGPAVFIDLGALHPGDLVDVTRSDATTAVFVVDSVQTYEKSAFPSQAVYGPTPGSALRLITCGGTFDRAKQLYLANVVVFATLRS